MIVVNTSSVIYGSHATSTSYDWVSIDQCLNSNLWNMMMCSCHLSNICGQDGATVGPGCNGPYFKKKNIIIIIYLYIKIEASETSTIFHISNYYFLK